MYETLLRFLYSSLKDEEIYSFCQKVCIAQKLASKSLQCICIHGQHQILNRFKHVPLSFCVIYIVKIRLVVKTKLSPSNFADAWEVPVRTLVLKMAHAYTDSHVNWEYLYSPNGIKNCFFAHCSQITTEKTIKIWTCIVWMVEKLTTPTYPILQCFII